MAARTRFIEHMTETDEDSNKTMVEAVALSVFQHFTSLTVALLTVPLLYDHEISRHKAK